MGGKKRKMEWRKKKMWLVGNHFPTMLSSREVVEGNCSLQTASAVGTSTEMTSSEMCLSLHYIVISGHICIAGQLFDSMFSISTGYKCRPLPFPVIDRQFILPQSLVNHECLRKRSTYVRMRMRILMWAVLKRVWGSGRVCTFRVRLRSQPANMNRGSRGQRSGRQSRSCRFE